MKNLEEQANIAKEIAKEYFGGIIPNLDEILNELKFESATTSSNFDYKTKTIHINLRYAHDINHFVHELFHAISTNYNQNGVQIGFNNIEFKDFRDELQLETNYGYALNEGTTHAFTRDATNMRFGEVNPISSYSFCANIYKNLENYTEKDAMKVLYTRLNTKDFINEISKEFHTNRENILKLILTMDCYLDTYRIYNVFFDNFESEDTSSLLSNCYTYLSKIISDKLKFEGKEFDISKNISTEHLSDDEKIVFNNAINKINEKDLTSKPSNISMEQFEKLAEDLYKKEYDKKLDTFSNLPDEFKCAEFYNFLILNNYFCSENRIRKDIMKSDYTASLTKKIFSEKYKAFNLDENLPNNIRTLLSVKFAIRAGCEISDYYMIESLKDEKFASYLKNSDNKYYDSLVNGSAMSQE